MSPVLGFATFARFFCHGGFQPVEGSGISALRPVRTVWKYREINERIYLSHFIHITLRSFMTTMFFSFSYEIQWASGQWHFTGIQWNLGLKLTEKETCLWRIIWAIVGYFSRKVWKELSCHSLVSADTFLKSSSWKYSCLLGFSYLTKMSYVTESFALWCLYFH